MKTTIDIADSLLSEAKNIAITEKTTVKALIERGLREVIEKSKEKPAFKLRAVSFKGNGLQPEFRGEQWDKIRSAAYEGHGG